MEHRGELYKFLVVCNSGFAPVMDEGDFALDSIEGWRF